MGLENFTRGELLKLVTENWVGRVTVAIQNAVELSFATDQVIRPVCTRDEIQRRFDICIKWFCIFRRDLHWSVPRILDQLYVALRSELDNIRYEPDEERSGWVSREGVEELEISDEEDSGILLEP